MAVTPESFGKRSAGRLFTCLFHAESTWRGEGAAPGTGRPASRPGSDNNHPDSRRPARRRDRSKSAAAGRSNPVLRCRVRRCQRLVWAATLLLGPLWFPARASSEPPPIAIASPRVTLALDGRLRLDVTVENRLPVELERTFVRIGWSDGFRDLELAETVGAHSSKRLDIMLAALPSQAGSVDVQLHDYELAPLNWLEARAVLESGDAPSERAFLRQLGYPKQPANEYLREELAAPLPQQPTVDEARLWTARVLWAKCRETKPVDELLTERAHLGVLEESFGLFRSAWLIEGRERAPLSAAIPREYRRFADLLAANGCPIRGENPSTTSSVPAALKDGSQLHDTRGETSARRFIFGIGALVVIFGLGLWIGRRRVNG